MNYILVLLSVLCYTNTHDIKPSVNGNEVFVKKIEVLENKLPNYLKLKYQLVNLSDQTISIDNNTKLTYYSGVLPHFLKQYKTLINTQILKNTFVLKSQQVFQHTETFSLSDANVTTNKKWTDKQWEENIKKQKIKEEKQRIKEEAKRKSIEDSKNQIKERIEQSVRDSMEARRVQIELSSSDTSRPDCVDLVFENIEILEKKNGKCTVVKFKVTNIGGEPIVIRKNKDYTIGIKIHFSGDPKLNRGDIRAKGVFLGDHIKDKNIVLEQGKSIIQEFEVNTRKKSIFTNYIIFTVDAFQYVQECDETNNNYYLLSKY